MLRARRAARAASGRREGVIGTESPQSRPRSPTSTPPAAEVVLLFLF